MFLFQEKKVEAEVDREAKDEAKYQVLKEMAEKSRNKKVEATTKYSTTIKEMINPR